MEQTLLSEGEESVKRQQKRNKIRDHVKTCAEHLDHRHSRCKGPVILNREERERKGEDAQEANEDKEVNRGQR